jgi:hypothetical protein
LNLSLIIFFIIVIFSPSPSVQWKKEAKLINKNEKVLIENSGKVLIIKNVILEDAGNYFCQASNKIGNARPYKITLTVQGKINYR